MWSHTTNVGNEIMTQEEGEVCKMGYIGNYRKNNIGVFEEHRFLTNIP